LAEVRKGDGSLCKFSLPDDVADKIGQFVYGQATKTKEVRRNLRYFSRMSRRRSRSEREPLGGGLDDGGSLGLDIQMKGEESQDDEEGTPDEGSAKKARRDESK
jgi:hypothetical protein